MNFLYNFLICLNVRLAKSPVQWPVCVWFGSSTFKINFCDEWHDHQKQSRVATNLFLARKQNNNFEQTRFLIYNLSVLEYSRNNFASQIRERSGENKKIEKTQNRIIKRYQVVINNRRLKSFGVFTVNWTDNRLKCLCVAELPFLSPIPLGEHFSLLLGDSKMN